MNRLRGMLLQAFEDGRRCRLLLGDPAWYWRRATEHYSDLPFAQLFVFYRREFKKGYTSIKS